MDIQAFAAPCLDKRLGRVRHNPSTVYLHQLLHNRQYGMYTVHAHTYTCIYAYICINTQGSYLLIFIDLYLPVLKKTFEAPNPT